MHKGSILRMEWFVQNYASKLNSGKSLVLDVGSYDVNGSYKHLFDQSLFDYNGLDMEAGPNVDIVLSHPYDWSDLKDDSYDIVISGQAFEHIEFFWKTMEEMTRVLKKDGLLCLIVPNGFGEHRYPVDCYRFFTDGMVALARYVGIEPLHAHTDCAPSVDHVDWYSDICPDSMLVARKTFSGPPRLPDFKTYRCRPETHENLLGGLKPRPKIETPKSDKSKRKKKKKRALQKVSDFLFKKKS